MYKPDPVLESKRKRLRTEMMLLDSDIRKNERLAKELEAEGNDLKKKVLQFQQQLQTNEDKRKKLANTLTVQKNDYKKLNVTINTLR
jgi:chromosome segregation ATPase